VLLTAVSCPTETTPTTRAPRPPTSWRSATKQLPEPPRVAFLGLIRLHGPRQAKVRGPLRLRCRHDTSEAPLDPHRRLHFNL
jgi:hypothetical protein